MANSIDLPVWRRAKLGTPDLRTAADYCAALTVAGCKISDDVYDLLVDNRAFTVATEEIEVELVTVTVAELGFPKGVIYAVIYTLAQEHGHALCPLELGPRLRLEYLDQPRGEWLLIAMEPLLGSEGYPSVWYVGRGTRNLWLRSNHGELDHFYDVDSRWVFCRRK